MKLQTYLSRSPHRSLQEFLGTFYFIQSLDKGKSMYSLQGYNAEPFMVTNHLFLYFCFWFVQHSEAYFTFKNLKNVRHTIEGPILKRINTPKFDLQSIATNFPAIDTEQIIKKKYKATSILSGDILSKCQTVRTLNLQSIDSLDGVLLLMRPVLPFINYITVGDILSKCQTVRTLNLQSIDSLDGVLLLMRPVLPFINYITVGDVCIMRRVRDVVIIETCYDDDRLVPHTTPLRDAHIARNSLLKYVSFLGVDLSIQMHLETNYDSEPLQLFSKLNCTNIKSIHIKERRTVEIGPKLKALPLFLHLQHLSFSSINFVTDKLLYLSETARVGNLPYLTHLSFANCLFLGSHLYLLFSSGWNRLIHLSFEECPLDNEDIRIIGNMQNNCLPNLKSMNLTNIDRRPSNITSPALIAQLHARFSTLQSLYLKIYDIAEVMKWKQMSSLKVLYLEENSSEVNASISPESLPPNPESLTLLKCVDNLQTVTDNLYRDNLIILGLSYNESIEGTLSTMLCDNFPSLKTLKLRGCCLNSCDLCSMARANVAGRLPKLTHLDISRNKLDSNEYANSLFAFSCKWNKLISLNIIYTYFSEAELHSRVQSGCLSSLQELRISSYPHQPVDIIWPHLQILGTINPSEVTLCNIADKVEAGRFPSLRSVCLEYLVPKVAPSVHKFSAFQRFTEAKILCHHHVIRTHEFENSKYRSGTVNSKSFVGKVFLRIKQKFELTYAL